MFTTYAIRSGLPILQNYQEVLSAQNTASQLPGATDTLRLISFGAAQGDGSSTAQLLADGTVIFHSPNATTELMDIGIFLTFTRTGATATSNLYGQFLLNTIPIICGSFGPFLLENSNDSEPYFVTFPLSVSDGDELQVVFWRDDNGDNSGGLIVTPSSFLGTDAENACIHIQRDLQFVGT